MASVAPTESKDSNAVLVKFAVSPVAPVLKPKTQLADKDLKAAWQSLGKLEACSVFNEPKAVIADVFSTHNVLAKAVHTAFYDHHPLRLTPDAIWQTIVQGFALHVNENAEELRAKFVKHQGKADIVIQRPSFVKGSPNNDWPGVFPEFSDKIAEHIGRDKQELLTSDFTTTGPTERIAAQIALMDVVKSYFRYVMMCGCGIPYIELTGTVADWESIRARTEKLEQYDLKWWTKELLPVLDQFVAAAKGQADTRFWQSICNVIAGSGFRRPLSGWIQCFFPYISKGDARSWQKNDYLGEWRKSYDNNAVDSLEEGMIFGMDKDKSKSHLCGRGVELKLLPSSLSSVPFVYIDMSNGKSYDMRFQAGLVATVCHKDTGVLEPRMGWGVVDVTGLPDNPRPPAKGPLAYDDDF